MKRSFALNFALCFLAVALGNRIKKSSRASETILTTDAAQALAEIRANVTAAAAAAPPTPGCHTLLTAGTCGSSAIANADDCSAAFTALYPHVYSNRARAVTETDHYFPSGCYERGIRTWRAGGWRTQTFFNLASTGVACSSRSKCICSHCAAATPAVRQLTQYANKMFDVGKLITKDSLAQTELLAKALQEFEKIDAAQIQAWADNVFANARNPESQRTWVNLLSRELERVKQVAENAASAVAGQVPALTQQFKQVANMAMDDAAALAASVLASAKAVEGFQMLSEEYKVLANQAIDTALDPSAQAQLQQIADAALAQAVIETDKAIVTVNDPKMLRAVLDFAEAKVAEAAAVVTDPELQKKLRGAVAEARAQLEEFAAALESAQRALNSPEGQNKLAAAIEHTKSMVRAFAEKAAAAAEANGGDYKKFAQQTLRAAADAAQQAADKALSQEDRKKFHEAAQEAEQVAQTLAKTLVDAKAAAADAEKAAAKVVADKVAADKAAEEKAAAAKVAADKAAETTTAKPGESGSICSCVAWPALIAMLGWWGQ